MPRWPNEATYGTNTGSTEATLYPRDTANVNNTGIGVFVVARHTPDASASTEPWSRKHIRQEVTRYSKPPDRTGRAASAYTYEKPLCNTT